MTPERWQAIKSAFLDLHSLPAKEQVAFLATLDQQDPDLAQAVSDLVEDSPEAAPDLRRPCG